MYKAVPTIYGSLFDIINDEFGKEGRGYIATFEKECMPRRGSDLIPKLFPWSYLHISKLGGRLTARRRFTAIGAATLGIKRPCRWLSLA